jgi:hypothetical protein
MPIGRGFDALGTAQASPKSQALFAGSVFPFDEK